MPTFIECAIPGRDYRSSRINNPAVNLDLCKSVKKSRIHWYPDNTGIPSIAFDGCNVEWAYNTDKQRDDDYARIVAAYQAA